MRKNTVPTRVFFGHSQVFTTINRSCVDEHFIQRYKCTYTTGSTKPHAANAQYIYIYITVYSFFRHETRFFPPHIFLRFAHMRRPRRTRSATVSFYTIFFFFHSDFFLQRLQSSVAPYFRGVRIRHKLLHTCVGTSTHAHHTNSARIYVYTYNMHTYTCIRNKPRAYTEAVRGFFTICISTHCVL